MTFWKSWTKRKEPLLVEEGMGRGPGVWWGHFCKATFGFISMGLHPTVTLWGLGTLLCLDDSSKSWCPHYMVRQQNKAKAALLLPFQCLRPQGTAPLSLPRKRAATGSDQYTFRNPWAYINPGEEQKLGSLSHLQSCGRHELFNIFLRSLKPATNTGPRSNNIIIIFSSFLSVKKII